MTSGTRPGTGAGHLAPILVIPNRFLMFNKGVSAIFHYASRPPSLSQHTATLSMIFQNGISPRRLLPIMPDVADKPHPSDAQNCLNGHNGYRSKTVFSISRLVQKIYIC